MVHYLTRVSWVPLVGSLPSGCCVSALEARSAWARLITHQCPRMRPTSPSSHSSSSAPHRDQLLSKCGFYSWSIPLPHYPVFSLGAGYGRAAYTIQRIVALRCAALRCVASRCDDAMRCLESPTPPLSLSQHFPQPFPNSPMPEIKLVSEGLLHCTLQTLR